MCVRPGMSVFVMVCETRPLSVYPIVFRHPGLPVGGKHSVFHFIHHHVRSFLLVSLIWHPARASSLRRRGWWKKKHLQHLTMFVNPTYSTFNFVCCRLLNNAASGAWGSDVTCVCADCCHVCGFPAELGYFNTVAVGCFSCLRVEATPVTWYLALECWNGIFSPWNFTGEPPSKCDWASFE